MRNSHYNSFQRSIHKNSAPTVFTRADTVSFFKNPAEVGPVVKPPCKGRFGNILMGAGHHQITAAPFQATLQNKAGDSLLLLGKQKVEIAYGNAESLGQGSGPQGRVIQVAFNMGFDSIS